MSPRLSVSQLTSQITERIFGSLPVTKFRVVLKLTETNQSTTDSYKVFGASEFASKEEAVNAGKQFVAQFNKNLKYDKEMTFGKSLEGQSFPFNPANVQVAVLDFQVVDGAGVKTIGSVRWDSESSEWTTSKV
jgi:hypothetical protein